MITKVDIMQKLRCSEVYAQKVLDFAHGDQDKLETLILQKLAERHVREAVIEIGS